MTPSSTTSRRAERRVAMWLGALALAVAGPFVQLYSAQPAARYTLTAAIVDHGTVALDRYEHALGVDRAVHEGRVYSDKPPGQPVLATAPYAAYRLVGGEPASEVRVEENLGLWWVTLWSSTVPFAGAVVLMWRLARRHHGVFALPAAVAVGFGTLLLPFSTLLYDHAGTAALLMATWLLVSGREARARHLLAAGALSGLAVAVEYKAVMVVAGFVVYAGVRWRRRAGLMAAAGLPFAAALASYHWLIFGHPLTTPIRTKQADKPGLYGIGIPDVPDLFEIFAGDRGFVIAPLALVAVGGLLMAVRGGGRIRTDATAALLVFTSYVLLQAGWGNPWGGEMPGPRYVAASLPFLVVGVAEAWSRWPGITKAATAISTLTMLLPTITDHLVGLEGFPVATYVHRVADGDLTPTLFTMAIGPAGWIAHAALVGVCAWKLLEAWRAEREAVMTQPPTVSTA